MIKKSLLATLLAGCAAAAMATVTLNPDGTGFVGKGDVQIPFGFNNAMMQAKATSTAFSLQRLDTYEAVCTWVTGEGTRGEKTHNVAHVRSTAVNAAIASDARKTGQWTGWNLKGFGETTTVGGEAPVVGGACPGNAGTSGTWTSVVQTSSTGGLYATIDGVSKLIY